MFTPFNFLARANDGTQVSKANLDGAWQDNVSTYIQYMSNKLKRGLGGGIESDSIANKAIQSINLDITCGTLYFTQPSAAITASQTKFTEPQLIDLHTNAKVKLSVSLAAFAGSTGGGYGAWVQRSASINFETVTNLFPGQSTTPIKVNSTGNEELPLTFLILDSAAKTAGAYYYRIAIINTQSQDINLKPLDSGMIYEVIS